MNYDDFLQRKLRRADACGFEPGELNANLFDWQADIVRWACRTGRAAIFADTGLGKTLMQLEWASQAVKHSGKRALILTPLAVAQQTAREAERFGIATPVKVCREQAEVQDGITITNYDRMHLFDLASFGVVVLDESSILKAYTGATKRRLCEAFRDTPLKLCCTATPSPNDQMELGNHSEFLGVMPSSEILSRWFINDSMKCGNYRLRAYAAEDYWRWVTSWAVCVTSPYDLGYDGKAFELPPLRKIIHEVQADIPPPDGCLFHFDRVSATNMHSVKRQTAADRAAKVAEIVAAEPDEPWLIWCDTDYEADALLEALPGATEIRGSHATERKEAGLVGFSGGTVKILVTKPELAGFGLNWQHCARMVFAGMSFSFERTYQAIRRCWRFGQRRAVDVHVVTSDVETGILDVIASKETAFQEMRAAMAEAVKESQLENLYGKRNLKGPETVKRIDGEKWTLYHGDCVEAVKQIDSDSVGLTVFSPPFSNLYIYSDSIADMGNSGDDAEFFAHFGYLIPELLRVTIPGRLCCVHCKDLPLYFNRDGAAGLKDFPGEIIRRFEAAGWTYHSRVTIWKDPVIEMQRTKNNGLLHKTLCRDSSQVRQGMADYMIAFRKIPATSLMSAKPVERPKSRANCFDQYIGSKEPVIASKWAKAGEPDRASHVVNPVSGKVYVSEDYGLQIWQRYASPVWFDIDQTRVLNYKLGTDHQDEKHICPLQLDVIERCVELWSAEGDVVFSPFTGIGSEGYCAVRMGRRFVGAELKDSYVEIACRNLNQAEAETRQEVLV